jgi:uncharacterized protein (TIGR02599 family)
MNHRRATPPAGFTLMEILVALIIVAVLTVLFAGIVNHTSNVWRRTTAKAEQFREARTAYESMTARLAQATLNTYWDYDNPTNPRRYERRSELRFISGPADDLLGTPPAGRSHPAHAVFFQAPLGITEMPRYRGYENLLCLSGYYLELGDDTALRPDFITTKLVPPRFRSRLMELWAPAERNTIYSFTSGPAGRTYSGREWFTGLFAADHPPVHVLAENIVALIITPRLAPADEAPLKPAGENADYSPLAPNFLYDSAPVVAANDPRYSDARLNPINQLPPLLEVTMVAIDERSAGRLGHLWESTDPFEIANYFRDTRRTGPELHLDGSSDSLESRLVAQHLNYRVFTTNVVIRAAKWSSTQTN